MTSEPLIFLVDDDPDVRDSMRALLESADYQVKDFGSAKDFLADRGTHGHCLIADIRMPEMDGLALQEEVVRRKLGLPVIIITGHGDVPLAVRAMKAGAIDFIEKPFDDEMMLSSIHRALEIGSKTRSEAAEAAAAERLLGLLTPRERNVLDQLVVGRSNKVAAYELGISPRTIEIHRAHIMDKMNARSLSDLVRISLAAGRPHGTQGGGQAGGHPA
ncbi:MAG TPA: response regulator [Rhizomicrobium sp.]|jgi:two-component system response regulator FixJ|nr:response regulator [Rhizomicrobium sp.]